MRDWKVPPTRRLESLRYGRLAPIVKHPLRRSGSTENWQPTTFPKPCFPSFDLLGINNHYEIAFIPSKHGPDAAGFNYGPRGRFAHR